MIASRSASGPIAQNTVSRMIIGGETGFRMMIALPRSAPPTASMACAVVSVNSSILARVPGPADREAIEATISAYGTGVTLETACTIGMVACPPQVIMLIFGASDVDVDIDRGADERPDGRRGQVDGDDPGLGVAGRVGDVRLGRGCLEHQIGQFVLVEQPIDATGAGLHPQLRGPGQAVGGRVDPDHVADLDVVAALQLDEQVGADVARPDDGGGRLAAVGRGSRVAVVAVVDDVVVDDAVISGVVMVASLRRSLHCARTHGHHQAMRTGERNTFDSVIGRAAALLGAFDARHLSMGVSELSRRSGLPKSTTARLAAELTTHGFLERTDGTRPETRHQTVRIGRTGFPATQAARGGAAVHGGSAPGQPADGASGRAGGAPR